MSDIDNLVVLETALAIRPHLSNLLEPQTASHVQDRLDQLLQQIQTHGSEDTSADQIWDLLTGYKATQIWITQFQPSLAHKEGAEDSLGKLYSISFSRGILGPGCRVGDLSGLPGDISSVSYHQFKCPLCDHTWSRDRVGRPTPLCPTHQIPLELIS
ncbi:MAG: hypothetical protein IGR80_12915 [Synechococcales cyanobacterium K44_A2020_017]|nr:hypothetical protein [Synechococcales cyanobacterium K32_A2020_035]MBF2095643.1 hypothetical protein [Synechococcales cyanobacterium K44_A2020_017]